MILRVISASCVKFDPPEDGVLSLSNATNCAIDVLMTWLVKSELSDSESHSSCQLEYLKPPKSIKSEAPSEETSTSWRAAKLALGGSDLLFFLA